ncbi:MAG TPA: sensor histidine kinase [Terriglobales bacterium]|nr:sensor histidine kinase [Terriglobales bacterium]
MEVTATVRRVWGRLRALDPRLVDVLIVIVLTGAVVVEFTQSGKPPYRASALLLNTVPLLWRRRFPIATYVIQNAGLFLWLAPPLITSLVAVFFGCYSMSLYSRHRAVSLAIPLAQAALLAVVGIPRAFYTPAIPAWLAELTAGVGVWLAGDAVRGLQERSRRLERERELVTQVAIAEEQARIARELHDIVAHSVSIMVVQAGAARRLIAGSPERAAEALQTVEESGRAALTELRQLLGVLSEESAEASLVPQPGLAQLDVLVERLRQTGFAVDLAREGTPRPLQPGLELAAYRVIQEALTNALKHAGGAPTRVQVRFADGWLDLEVRNARGPAAPEAEGAGRGLVGMRQRVAVYGGDVEAGPLPEGGFAVRARLPLGNGEG